MNASFTVTTDGLERLVKDLEDAQKRAFPYAARNALNGVAFEGRKIWQDEISRTMTVRNTFTTRSVRVVNATGNSLQVMRATLGSTASYMGEREDDAVNRSRGKRGVPIPTPAAAGQGRAAKRTALVRRPNRLKAITLAGRIGQGSRKQRNAATIRIAAKTGMRFVFLDLGRRQGLFRVQGRKRNLKVEMLWDLSRSSVKVRANPTLGRTLKRLESRAGNIMRDALIGQLKRNKVFGY